MKKIGFCLMVFVFVPVILFAQAIWHQTSATVSFTIKNRGSDVNGHFSGLNTKLIFSPDKLSSSSLKGSLEVGTISTGINKRDEDLKEEKYFDAGKYKLIEMSSVKLSKSGAQYSGTFNVTIKGMTRQVEIPFEFIQQGNEAAFKGAFTIDRRDFGVGTKGGLAMFMADDVHVTIDIKAKK
ncbi:MAG: hypothetical protein JWQ38_2440 [Flavipsychrobacter sp.]|nr:hypothetical protein [Flavipsychrobacter sp.]